MTSDQQRTKIAELCGWEAVYYDKDDTRRHCGSHSCFEGHVCWVQTKNPRGYHPPKHKGEPPCVPDYLNSLNAMAEAEQHPDLDQDKYSKWLWVVVTGTPIPVQDPWDVINENAFPQFDLYSAAPFRSATAAQRAKAFLLTFDPSLTFC